LTGAIRKALNQAEPVLLSGIKVGTNGGTQLVDVTVKGLEGPELLRGRVLIVFKDVAAPPPALGAPRVDVSKSHQSLLRELLESRESLRMLREETQASLEELKSANEELQSTNEEMQSTNEELTTSKEEMQSMNEEMRTVNNELQSKVQDLTWERNDMANLLNSTEIATVFLDNELRLRRFTAFATKLFKLLPGDLGRPLSDLVTELDYPRLEEDARDVLRTLVFSEKEVGARDGRWYRARIMPYRTQDNMIDGVVSTFVDITQTKLLEAELRRLGAQGSK
jgi:PAS domain-containing protein